MQEDEKKLLRLRSRDIQIEDTYLGRHQKTQVLQFEASFDTICHQEQEDWLKKLNLMKMGDYSDLIALISIFSMIFYIET